jgi:hypothetical protein
MKVWIAAKEDWKGQKSCSEDEFKLYLTMQERQANFSASKSFYVICCILRIIWMGHKVSSNLWKNNKDE